jgi:pantoate--beta-alanine ligase
MKLIKSSKLLNLELQKKAQNGVTIGLIPTMGALHPGHLTLIQRARQENDSVVCSIFVNPKQFNETKDLTHYPRPISKDIEMLNKADVDYIFHPEVDDIYDSDYVDTDLDLKGLDLVLEGLHRPTHFQGMAKVVKQLFQIVKPNRAYFGQKDFQQSVVVRLLISQYFPDIELVVCPIARESHGLAMSSRNVRLSEKGLMTAAFLYKSLLKLKERSHFKSIPESLESTARYLSNIDNAEVEYLAVVDGYTMREVTNLDEAEMVVAVAVVKYEGVRLLDNIILKK